MAFTILPIILAVVLAAWYSDEVLVRSTKVRPAKSPSGLASEHFPKVVLGLAESNNFATSVSGEMCADLGAPEPKSLDAKSIPSPEVLLRSLNRSVAASRADPCNAQVLLRHFHFGAGFGAKINNMVTAVINALIQEPPLSLALAVEEANPFHQYMWLQHFVNDLDIPTCTKPKGSMVHGPIFVQDTVERQIYYGLCEFRAMSKHPVESFRLRHAVLSKFFTLNANTSSLIEQQLAALNLGENYVGVHIRQGDKGADIHAEPFDSARYAGHVSANAKRYNISTVFVASDAPNAAAILQKALPAMTVKSAPKLDARRYDWTALGSDDGANLAFLTDIVGLSRSKLFVGTASSNIGRMIYRLREETQKQDSISLDSPFPE